MVFYPDITKQEQTMQHNNFEILKKYIGKRVQKSNLSFDLEKIIYGNNFLFKYLKNKKFKNALYIGLGHGFYAILTILQGYVENITGVDPYDDEQGGEGCEDSDYEGLKAMTAEYNMDEALSIKKMSIDDFLKNEKDRYDLIIARDVLHHIFKNPNLISKTDMHEQAINLFKQLKNLAHENTLFIVSDVGRYGLLPLLKKWGIVHDSVRYYNKQPSGEWTSAMKKADWQLIKRYNYVPFKLRNISLLFRGYLNQYFLANRYFLYFKNK